MQNPAVTLPLPTAASPWSTRLSAVMALHFEFFTRARALGWPLLDLLVRAWLAQAYLVSGVIKLSDWDNALHLARYEYPVPWLEPGTAALAGAAIELVAPVFLLLGLATRAAALPMLVLALVVQTSYVVLDQNLLWAALLALLVVRGAGPLSLDHALRGLADSAVPFARQLVRAAATVSRVGVPVLALLLRGWLGVALLVAHRAVGWPQPDTAAPWLPWTTAPSAGSMTVVLAALLLAGLATRYTALAMLLATLAGGMLSADATVDACWLMLLGVLALHGAGAVSLDEWLGRALRHRFPELDGRPAFSLEGLPRVVIVGAGFGGLACADALRRARVRVTLVDRANHHLFQPLLYQVATAGLSPGDIAAPVRSLFREAFNVRVLLGTVTGVDTTAREVLVDGQRLPYDHLVLATGATHGYFGRDEWQAHAPGLKRIEDALEIRRRLLVAFERAEACEDAAERAALTTFLVVGGGPTGVELAGAIAELARHGMERDFRRFDPAEARVVLVQAGPRVLPTFPEKLSACARRDLERLGVEVLTDSRVDGIDDQGVLVNGLRIPARTVLWAAGVVASPAARWLDAAADRAGRVVVGPDLAVAGLPGVYAVGDTAASDGWHGQPVPGLAPAAKQGGQYVATVIRARVEGRAAPAPFAYRHRGSLATIGRKAAVAQFGPVGLWGAPAWWLWGLVHVGFLVGMRNRIATVVNWFWSYLTFRAAVRLITGAPTTTTPD